MNPLAAPLPAPKAIGVPRPMTLGVPAYGHPVAGDMWERLAQLPTDAVVILNPASGPGIAVDPAYTGAARRVT